MFVGGLAGRLGRTHHRAATVSGAFAGMFLGLAAFGHEFSALEVLLHTNCGTMVHAATHGLSGRVSVGDTVSKV